jgi:hypothetical protein
MKYQTPLDPKVAAEGIARTTQSRNVGGRPKKQLPLSTLLRKMPSVEQQIIADPKGYDPGVGDKQLSLLGRIIFERGLCADDAEIPLRAKVGLAVQILQFIEGSKSTIWRKEDAKHPRTSEALDKEIHERNRKLERLRPYLAKRDATTPSESDVELVVEALRPPGEPQ